MRAKIRHRKISSQLKQQKRNWVPFALLGGGTLLLGIILFTYIFAPSPATASMAYDPADVAYDQPVLAMHAMGEGPTIPFLPQNQPQPKIQVSEKFYDFGTIGPKDVMEREFVVRNTGEAPLTISRAYTTCGCTTAEFSATVIQPGQVAIIKLIFDAGFHDSAGQTVRRGLIIENNDPQQSQAEIWVQAAVSIR